MVCCSGRSRPDDDHGPDEDGGGALRRCSAASSPSFLNEPPFLRAAWAAAPRDVPRARHATPNAMMNGINRMMMMVNASGQSAKKTGVSFVGQWRIGT